MTLAVDKPIQNNPFEEPKEYWIYDEGQLKRMPGRRPAGTTSAQGIGLMLRQHYLQKNNSWSLSLSIK